MGLPDTLVTDVQQQTASSHGLEYFWRLMTTSGKEIDQFDPVTGAEQQFPNWVEWYSKPPLDPYAGNPAFRGLTSAMWVPTTNNRSANLIEIGNAHSIIIFRKNYVRAVGMKYVAYCLGLRWEDDAGPRESIYHITPPARYDKENDAMIDLAIKGRGLLFEGGTCLVESPIGKNLFDRFLEANSIR